MSWASLKRDKIFPRVNLKSIVKMKFENIDLPIPIGFDSILKIEYGDYSKPIINGSSHEYGFSEWEQKLFNEMKNRNMKIPDYLLQ